VYGNIFEPYGEANGCPWNKRVCDAAAREGKLEALKWAREEHACPWDSELFMNAALGGHVAVIEWARANGLAPGPFGWVRACSAAGHGQLDCLKWLMASVGAGMSSFVVGVGLQSC
jgi:hypothetical protein